MCTYLDKRGSTYYFRRPIPKRLQPAFNGAAVFIWSLRTKDREAAKLLTIETDGRLQAARRGHAGLAVPSGEWTLRIYRMHSLSLSGKPATPSAKVIERIDIGCRDPGPMLLDVP